MKRIIGQIAVLGMMTITAQAEAGELNAMEAPSVQGRIFISVTDFQKVLRGSERILSSESSVPAQEVRSSNETIAALQAMDAQDKAMLYKKVLPLAKKQAQALSTAVESLKTQLAQTKKERKALQAARLSQSQDGKLQEKLFSNLMEESNLEAKIAEAQRQIEESSVLALEFYKSGESLAVVSIQHGQNNLWSLGQVSGAHTAVAIVQN